MQGEIETNLEASYTLNSTISGYREKKRYKLSIDSYKILFGSGIQYFCSYFVAKQVALSPLTSKGWEIAVLPCTGRKREPRAFVNSADCESQVQNLTLTGICSLVQDGN